jgi:hypothetical protein
LLLSCFQPLRERTFGWRCKTGRRSSKQAAGDYRSVVGGKKGVGSVNFGAYKNVGSQIGRDVKGGVDKIKSAVIERPKPQDSSDNSPQFV